MNVYKNKKDYENGKRDRQVFPDGKTEKILIEVIN
jgi:hypothetical protein